MKRLLAPALALALLAQGAAPAPSLQEEAATKLGEYLRIDTSNPPGREEETAKLIARWLAADGVASRILVSEPGRGNLIARLKGSGPEKPLMLLHHMDVVPAEPARWKHPPFAGEEADGAIWGRGALDMKGFGVMQVMAFLQLVRDRVPLRRDVILAATADEEAGAEAGVPWLLANHPAELDASEVLNEGGAGLLMKNGQALMGIQTAERGTFWLRATAKGATGHGSRERPDSATRRLLRAMARLEAAPRALELGPESRGMLRGFATAETGLAAFALHAAAHDWVLPLLGPRLIAAEPALAPLLANTVNPTVLAAGTNTNVIPGEASAEVDIRILPGRTTAATLAWVKDVAAVPGDPPLEWTVLHERAPSRSAAAGPLWDALVGAVGEEYPGVPVLPILTPGGGTDSAFFRERGVQALGCMPIMATQAQIDAIHGDDEFVTREQLERGSRAVYKALIRAAGR